MKMPINIGGTTAGSICTQDGSIFEDYSILFRINLQFLSFFFLIPSIIFNSELIIKLNVIIFNRYNTSIPNITRKLNEYKLC